MSTYVAILTWRGEPRATRADVSASIAGALPFFRARGLNSLSFVDDERACTAVMVARCADASATKELAAAIVPGARVHVESIRFDEPALPGWIARDAGPDEGCRRRERAYARDYRSAVLAAVCGE